MNVRMIGIIYSISRMYRKRHIEFSGFQICGQSIAHQHFARYFSAWNTHSLWNSFDLQNARKYFRMTLAWTAYISYFIGRVYDDAINLVAPFAIIPSHPICFLGLGYDTNGTDNATNRFLDDFQSRIFLPYRKDFQPIVIPDVHNATDLTTDEGWGCAIRSTQMLVAQSISSIRLEGDFGYHLQRMHRQVLLVILSGALPISRTANFRFIA